MDCLVIGQGSIGSRHAFLLSRLGHSVWVVSSKTQLAYPCYPSVDAAFSENGRFDYLVVADRTVDHAATLRQILTLKYQGTILVEKPLFSFADQAVPVRDPSRVFVGYNLRFHPVLQKMQELMQGRRIFSMSVYAGSFLPDWRPGDYRECYSAHRAQGGGVLRDLSHELDYVCWLAGAWKRVAALGGTIGDLGIDSDDAFGLLLETENCPLVTIQVNYLDRVARREIVVNLAGESLRADLVTNQLWVNNEAFSFQAERNETYEQMHKAILLGQFKKVCSYEEGLQTMRLIDAAERAVTYSSWCYAGREAE